VRIEKKFNKLDGVLVSVNYVIEKVKVIFFDSVFVDDLVLVVEVIGYGVMLFVLVWLSV